MGGREEESFLECKLLAAKQMNLKASQWGMMNKFLQLEMVNGNKFYNAHTYSFKIYKMSLSLDLFNVLPLLCCFNKHTAYYNSLRGLICIFNSTIPALFFHKT